MIRNIAKKLTNYVISKEGAKQKDFEIYFYGFQIAVEVILNFITTIIIAMVFGVFDKVIIFLLAFIPLRAFAGGIHLRKYWQCFITSIITIFFSIFFSFYVSISLISLIVLNTILMLTIYYIALLRNGKQDFDYFRIHLVITFLWIWIMLFVTILLKEKNIVISCALFVELISLILSKKVEK